MALLSKSLMPWSLAFPVLLAGCGGGGSTIASMPPPPPSVAAPVQTVASISAPAGAVVPSTSVFPVATVGGPTVQVHPSTTFPLLQSVVTVVPGTVAAGTATMSAGATITNGAPGGSYQLDVGNPSLGVSHVTLQPSQSGSRTIFQADLSGGATAFLDIVNPATSNLSWTSYGFWDVHASTSYTNTAFTTGYATPAAAVPTSGSATYQGSVIGEAFHPHASGIDGVDFYQLSGDVTLQANFASGSISGSLTNMITRSFEGDTAPWNSVALAGSITGAQFGGTSMAISAPVNSGSLSSAATGTFAGMFFGPKVEELGAVWTLFDGTSSAVGSFGASTDNSGGAGYWDY